MSTEPAAVALGEPLTLSEPMPSRVIGGTPYLDDEELLAAIPNRAAGEAFELLDASGSRVGFGIFDGENRLIRTLPAHPDERLDLDFFRRRVGRAAGLRRRMGLVDETSAFRLINSEGDNLSGFLVDIYAGHAILYTYSAAFEPYARLLAQALEHEIAPESVVWKVRPSGETPTGRVDYHILAGSEPPTRITVSEEGARYEVHLLGGLNTGFFTDMREVRQALIPWVAGRRVLNTFAYTGSFSVVAALAKAKSVTTVDFAAGVLNWAKTNFTLNDLPAAPPKYSFVRADVFDYLKAARRKERSYDVVILDPPAATGVPGRRWFLKSDYDRLIGHALRLMPAGSLLVVAASSMQSRPEGVENQIRAAAREQQRRLRLLQSFGPPVDFPTQMIHPQSRHLKCFFLLVE